MYMALRFFGLMLRTGGFIWAVLGVFGFSTFIFDARIFLGQYVPPVGSLLLLLIGGFVLFHWLLLCLGMYAAGQFIQLMISLEASAFALRTKDSSSQGRIAERGMVWEPTYSADSSRG